MRNSERGDTLVEVLIATAILGAAIVGGLTIMNFGYSIASNAVERTQVEATMNSQLSLIRYARDGYLRANQQATDPASRLWVQINSKATTGVSSETVCTGSTPAPTNGFYVRDDFATLGNTGSVVDYSGTVANGLARPGTGMWVEARKSRDADTTVKYIDFYVKACWEAVGSNPQQEARTVMRLYVTQ